MKAQNSSQQEDRLIRNEAFVEKVKDNWIKIFNFLTYSGYKKQKIYESLDEKFGPENWLPAHFFDGQVVSRYQGFRQYDEAYYEFLKNNPDVREWIVDTASEVIDFAESNIQSGLDLSKQEGPATHLQDISVRRALTRLALEEQGKEYDPENLPTIPIFKGDHIVKIRDHTTEGYRLNPGQVPFHKPELGLDMQPTKDPWWKKDSAEDIYQKNKVLLVNPKNLELRLAMVSQNDVFLAEDKYQYYGINLKNPKHFTSRRGKDVRRSSIEGKLENYCEIIEAPTQKTSELIHLAEQYLEKLPKLNKKRLTFKGLKTQMENAGYEEILEFDIDRLEAADPFDLNGYCKKYNLGLRDHYIGCISDLAKSILNQELKSGGGGAGGKKVVTSFSYNDGSHAVSESNFKEGTYTIQFQRAGRKLELLEQLKKALNQVCSGQYEVTNSVSNKSETPRLMLRYKTEEQNFVYAETSLGRRAFSYDSVTKIPKGVNTKIDEVHVKKIEKA